jgi:hypothetical protein
MFSLKNMIDILKSIGSKHSWEGEDFIVTLKSQWLVEYRDRDRVAEIISEPLVDGPDRMHRAIYLRTIKWKCPSGDTPATDEEKKIIAERVRKALVHLEPSAEIIC